MIKVKSIQLDDDNVLRITVVTANGTEHITMREHLRSPTNPDIGWISSSVPEFKTAASELSEEDLEQIASPMHLSQLQQEFLSLHCRLLNSPILSHASYGSYWTASKMICKTLK